MALKELTHLWSSTGYLAERRKLEQVSFSRTTKDFQTTNDYEWEIWCLFTENFLGKVDFCNKVVQYTVTDSTILG